MCNRKWVLRPSRSRCFLRKAEGVHSGRVIDEGDGEFILAAKKSLVKFRNTWFESLTTGHALPPPALPRGAAELWSSVWCGTELR